MRRGRHRWPSSLVPGYVFRRNWSYPAAMPRTGSPRGFGISVTLAAAVWAGDAIAQEAETAAWCVDNARLWPDGAAVKFDTRYLRICQPWFGAASGGEALLGVNAAVIPVGECLRTAEPDPQSRGSRDEVKANMLRFLTRRGTARSVR